jgi:hypothetical protein
MTTSLRTPGPARDLLAYRVATGLLCAVFLISVLLTVVDYDGTVAQLRDLGFPTYFAWPQTIAKLLGVVAILSRRSRTLALFAYAGFLFDMLLALTAHVAEREPYALVAVAGLVVWGFAFAADRRRFGPATY